MSQNVVPVTSSTIAAAVSTGCHVLKLSGYSQAKLLIGAGKYVESPRFEAAGHSWRVVVYPNGNRRECCGPDDGISLGLMLDEESKAAHVRFQFSFVRHGNKLTAGKPLGGGVIFTFQSTRAYREVGMGELQEDPAAYVKDDAVLIRCDITVFSKPAVVKQKRRDGPPALTELFCDCNDHRCSNVHFSNGDKGSEKLQSHLITTPKTKLTNGYLPLSSRDDDGVVPPPPSASTIAVTASTACHVVKVSGYCGTKLHSKNGTPVVSAAFKVAGHTWRIWCYPNGHRKERAGYMSLYLVLAGESTNVHARFHFSLLPHGKLTTEAPHGGATASTAVFERMHDSWGFSTFMSNAEVEGTGFLTDDDCLFIRCDLTVMHKPVIQRRDPETLHLLCDCNDDLCNNIHRKAAASRKPSRHVLKKMLLGCLSI